MKNIDTMADTREARFFTFAFLRFYRIIQLNYFDYLSLCNFFSWVDQIWSSVKNAEGKTILEYGREDLHDGLSGFKAISRVTVDKVNYNTHNNRVDFQKNLVGWLKFLSFLIEFQFLLEKYSFQIQTQVQFIHIQWCKMCHTRFVIM